MKKGYKLLEPVIVHWNDAWSNDSIKLLTEEAIEFGEFNLRCRTLGFLLDYNNNYILLSGHYSEQRHGDNLQSDIFQIPTGMIVKVERLKIKKA